jgi:hypothetical protein
MNIAVMGRERGRSLREWVPKEGGSEEGKRYGRKRGRERGEEGRVAPLSNLQLQVGSDPVHVP